MPKFKYVARDSAGKRVQRSMDAATREEVVSALRRDGLVVGPPGRASRAATWRSSRGSSPR